ncbi:MAG: transglutaminase family protein, partial [Labilithrix sp.]|nr:transglutaminase family protein [Labilithrix sp.]
MSIHVALHHRTSYAYDRLVSVGPQSVRLRPAPHCRSRILAYSLKVAPAKHFINWQQDPQSNYVARLVFPEKTTELSIEVDLVVEMAAQNPFDFFLEPYAEQWPFEYEAALEEDLAPFLRPIPASPLLDAFVAEIPRTPRLTNDFLVDLNRRLSELVAYGIRLEAGVQTPDETLAKRAGSCRDSGWLLVQILRRLGLAARFVSGYLVQLTADMKPLDGGPEGPASDFCDLHAWCEVYLPGAGWIGLDPTSGLYAGEGHLPLACTAEPALAAPVSGLVDACEAKFDHAMSVERIFEVPRVTRPYTDDQWNAIVALGRAIDADLDAGDVRLTMGGEPTFVSAVDLEGEEWSTAALGPSKRAHALDLYRRLRDRYAPNGLVHFGQGKWYPGEPLPRWSLDLFWRNDGAAMWSDPSLVAALEEPREDAKADAALAERFARSVASKLAIDARHAFAAYEDAHYYLWREGRLPANASVLDAKLDDPLERDRLRRVFTAGLDAIVGWALPMGKRTPDAKIESAPWHFKSERCFLVPGDSPMGLRLPLARKPWLGPDDADEPKEWRVRTAMCVEPRGGVLHVFMPPAETLDDYVALLRVVEAAASDLRAPVRIEGYTPPRDPRLVRLSVTPDPGVIEVNVHPASSWNELVATTVDLYEDARL